MTTPKGCLQVGAHRCCEFSLFFAVMNWRETFFYTDFLQAIWTNILWIWTVAAHVQLTLPFIVLTQNSSARLLLCRLLHNQTSERSK